MTKKDKATIQAITKKRGDELVAIASDETVDRVGDKLKATEWDFTNFLKNPVLQAGHDYKPQYTIGKAENIRVEGKKVLFTPKFHDITQLAREISKMYQEGFLTAWSVGFIPAKEEGMKHELLEVSAVAVPANPNAVTHIKSLKSEAKEYGDDVAEKIKEWIEEKSEYTFRKKDIFNKTTEKNRVSKKFKKSYTVVSGKIKGVEKLQSFVYDKKEWTEKEIGEHADLHKTVKGVIPYRDTGIADENMKWNGGTETKKAEVSDLLVMSTWFDTAEPDVKSSYKLPHHSATGNHPAVWKGVAAAMGALLGARGGVDVPDSDRKAIYNHLKKHYVQFEKEVPEFKEYSEEDIIKLEEKGQIVIEKQDIEVMSKHFATMKEKVSNIIDDNYGNILNDLGIEKIEKPKKKSIEYKERWNLSLSKQFDIENVDGKVSGFENELYTKFLGQKIKNVFVNSYLIPSPLLGSYLSAFKEVMKEFELADTRNFDWSGGESSPLCEVIQLNSNKSDDFIIKGSLFYKKDSKNYVIMKFFPTWEGLAVDIISRAKDKEENKELLKKCKEWVKENNYLKNEKFALSGQFLDKTEDSWDSVILESENEKAIKLSSGLISKKGNDFNSRGILLVGPPGTGKTTVGKIMMNEIDSTFIWVSSRDFRGGSVGAMSLAFKLARDLSPSVLFVEDIDTWLTGYTVDLLKTELDGVQKNKGIVTILTSNYPEKLPEALIDRPGRFHDVIELGLPNIVLREKMLKTFLGVKEIEKGLLDYILKETEGFSGAHMKELVEFAKMISEDSEGETIAYLKEALEKLIKQRNLIGKLRKTETEISDEVTKAVENAEIEVKEGRVISTKNKKIIEDAISSQKLSIEALEKLLGLSEVVVADKPETPEKNVSSKMAHKPTEKEIIVRALQKIAGNSSYLLSKLKDKNIN